MTNNSASAQASEEHQLKRELKVTDAASFSMSLIGPVGAMALRAVDVAARLRAGRAHRRAGADGAGLPTAQGIGDEARPRTLCGVAG